MRSKYDFLMKWDQIGTTQDFIDKAATKSSVSGRPCEVRCDGDAPMRSSLWLSNELARYRASRR